MKTSVHDARIASEMFDCTHLRVQRVVGHEAISKLFAFDVDVVVVEGEGPPRPAMLGKRVRVELHDSTGALTRRFVGNVLEIFERLDGAEGARAFTLRVVPRAQALVAVSTFETFLDVSVPDLLHQKMDAVGIAELSTLRLEGRYPKRDFLVQFGETDFAFLSRLAEHVGISYFFDHGDPSASRIVWVDGPNAFGRLEGPPRRVDPRGEERSLTALGVRHGLAWRTFSVHDYDDRTPLVDLSAQHELEGGFAGGVIEFGSHHTTLDEARDLARVRAEEHGCQKLVYEGRSNDPSLSAGYRVLVEIAGQGEPLDLLVTEVEHHATLSTGSGTAGELTYANTFKAIPADRTFRPARSTPQPRIHGIVTGVIEGLPGALEGGILPPLDLAGCYRVRFHFDAHHPGDRAASLPIRMAQNHAGAGYGTHFPLKPGTEVAVAFLGGDPDRPVIVGALPNALAPSPVSAVNPGMHRIATSQGITLDLVE